MSQPASGPEDDGYIGYMLSDVARLIRTVFDRRVRDMGLTRGQWLVLTGSTAGRASARPSSPTCWRSTAPAPAA